MSSETRTMLGLNKPVHSILVPLLHPYRTEEEAALLTTATKQTNDSRALLGL